MCPRSSRETQYIHIESNKSIHTSLSCQIITTNVFFGGFCVREQHKIAHNYEVEGNQRKLSTFRCARYEKSWVCWGWGQTWSKLYFLTHEQVREILVWCSGKRFTLNKPTALSNMVVAASCCGAFKSGFKIGLNIRQYLKKNKWRQQKT